MEPITTLGILANSLGLSISLVKAAALLDKKIKKKRKAQFLARWREGHLILGTNRKEVTRLLYDYYRSTNEDTNLRGLWYSLKEEPPRPLPLVTRCELMKDLPPDWTIQGSYVPGSIAQSRISEQEIIDQVAAWSILDMDIWDKALFSLRSIDAAGNAEFQLTKFLAYRATYGSLVDELALGLSTDGIEAMTNNLPEAFPLRNRLLGDTDDLMQFASRISAGGPAVLFAAFTGKDQISFLVQSRSYHVSDELGALTVIPKAFHQPMIDPAFEADPVKTVMRECFHELFDGEETQRGSRHVDPEFYLAKSEAVRELTKDKITIKSLGVVWDLTRGNYHPLYCLFVRDTTWWARHHADLKLNWEVQIDVRPVISASDPATVAGLLNQKNWAPEAYVALVEGLRWLSQNPETSSSISSIAGLLPDLHFDPLNDVPLGVE